MYDKLQDLQMQMVRDEALQVCEQSTMCKDSKELYRKKINDIYDKYMAKKSKNK